MRTILATIFVFFTSIPYLTAEAQVEQRELVGMTLGLTPDEAFSIVEAAGYVPYVRPVNRVRGHIIRGPSYQQIFEITKAGGHYSSIRPRNRATVQSADFTRPESSEGLTLAFTPFADGPRLSTIYYANRTLNITQDDFAVGVVERFGEPTTRGKKLGGAHEWRWLFDPVPSKTTFQQGRVMARPGSETLVFEGAGPSRIPQQYRLVLTGGDQLKDVLEDITEAIQAATPKPKTTF